MDDRLHAFVLPELGVRGAAVRIAAGHREIVERQPYAAGVARLLGEALAASALLIAGLKFSGRLSIQLQGAQALGLLYAECTSAGHLRGIARGGEDGPPDAGFVELRLDGLLVITLEPDASGERYQGVVPLEGAHLGEALEVYFAQSEQLPTRVLLAADEHIAAGLLLQRLPGEGGHGPVDPDGWNRAEHLAATVAPAELLSCDPELLLHRLFHDVPRIDAEALPLYPRCRCSREKVADVLRRIGREESLAAVQQSDKALVTCEFCGKTYRFDRIDIEALFLPQPPPEGGPASLQ